MKKLVIFAISALALLAVSCGPRAAKVESTDVDSTAVEVVDSTVVDSLAVSAADSVVVE